MYQPAPSLDRLSWNFILGISCKSGKKIFISLKLDKIISHLREGVSTSVLLQQYQMLCFWTNYQGSPLLNFHGKNQQVCIVDKTMWHNTQREPIVVFPLKCFLNIHIDSSSGYTNAKQCYVMCMLPVLLTCDICKILQWMKWMGLSEKFKYNL